MFMSQPAGAWLLNAIAIEFSLAAGTKDLQGAGLAHRIGPDENPVLPGGQAAEDPRLQRLARTKTQIRLHAGQGIGRQCAALLECKANLIVPVERIGRRGNESEAEGILGV